MCSKRSRACYWLEDNRRFRHRVCTRTLLHAHHTLSSVRSHFHPFLASVASVASVAVRVISVASVTSVACVASVTGVASVADSKGKQLCKLSFLVVGG